MATTNYDNTAFTFFLLTGLFIFIALSGLYSAIRLYLKLFRGGVKPDQARSAKETARLKKLDAEQRSCRNVFTRCFTINLLLLAAAIIAATVLVSSVEGDDIARFDPFEILGVESSATHKEIKSAYRRLSLKYHPDKNPGDKEAEAMFVQVAKAHQALTDEVARENYEKYGNPDGRQSTEVSIGLPTWLLDKDKSNAVVYMYLALLAVIFFMVYLCQKSASKQGSKVLVESERAFARNLLKGEKPSQNIHDVFLLAHEFRKPPRRPNGARSVEELAAELKKEFRIATDGVQHAAIEPREVANEEAGYCHQRVLLQSYLHRMESPAPADVAFLLSWMDKMVAAMIELLHISVVPNNTRFTVAPAERRLLIAQNVIKFSQRCVQAIDDVDRQSLEQLPYLDSEEFKASRRRRNAMAIRDFLEAPEEKRLRILEPLTPEQREEVIAVADALPLASVTVSAKVDDRRAEQIVSQRDIMTLKVTLERDYLDDSIEEAPAVHAPYYPTVKEEGWWALILLTNEAPPTRGRGRKALRGKSKKKDAPKGMLLMMKMSEGKKKDAGKLVCEKKFPAPPPNTYKVHVVAMCDSYAGLDVEADTTFATVAPPAGAPVSSGGHGHSHGGKACHGHGEPEVKDYTPPMSGDEDEDEDELEDDGGIMAGIAAARAAAAAKAAASPARGGSGGQGGGSGLTARQQAQRARRMMIKERRRKERAAAAALAAGEDPEAAAAAVGDGAAEPAAASESEDDEWSEMLALANE